MYEIEQSYQDLLDLRLRMDRYLSRKLEFLRRNWCKPYDASAQRCFMLGTWVLLICAALLIIGFHWDPGFLGVPNFSLVAGGSQFWLH